MHTELASHDAVENWIAGDTNTAHDNDDQAGLHDDDILVLAFLRISIADQLFQFMSRQVLFSLFIFYPN
jgi:hypothetical protein